MEKSRAKAAVSTTKPLVTALRKRPQVSARVALEPAVAVESLYECRNELIPLFVRFWRESGKDGVELDPDWETLLRMTAMGLLVVVTVRNGMLCGFLLNVIQPQHLFSRGLAQGSTVAYWLDPSLRAGWFPVKMFRRNLEFLRERGVKRVFIAADAAYEGGRAGRIFERLGYKLHETHYSMVL